MENRLETYHIKVKETNFSFGPANSWVGFRSTLLVGKIHFLKQLFIPFGVNLPVLHRMRDVGRLNQVFDDNRRFAIRISENFQITFFRDVVAFECSFPSCISRCFEFLIHNTSQQVRSRVVRYTTTYSVAITVLTTSCRNRS